MDLETARKIAELERRLDAIQAPETLGNYNIITVPDNVADALHIVDDDSVGAGSPEYLRVISTDTEPTLRFRNTEIGSWYDFQLVSAAEGDHFRQNAATFPAGWVETDAAAGTVTSSDFSFWRLIGNAGNVSYDYRRQTGITIEGLAANAWASFQFGPILFRDGAPAADVDYYFGIHGETAAAIDLTEYVRVHLQWNSAGGIWRVRGESDNGAGQTASGWTTLDAGPLHQPLFFRIVIRNNAAVNTTREYFGSVHLPIVQTLLQSVGEATTWGQVYWRINQTRGAGLDDVLLVGAVDYLAGWA